MTDRKALAAWTLLQGHRFIWNLVLTVALMMVVVALFMRSTAENAEANLIESRARAKARMLPPIPEEENAAELYRKSFALTPKVRLSSSPNLFDAESANAGLKLELLRSKEIQDFIASCAPALEMGRQASKLERCNWGTDYTQASTPDYYSGLRRLTRYLMLEAASFAEQGEHAAAAENMRAVSRISRHCVVDASMISVLVSTAIRSINMDGLQKIIFLYPPTRPDEVKAYREAVCTDDDPWLGAQKMMVGELDFMLITLDEGAVKQQVFNIYEGLMPTAIDVPYVPWYGSDRKTLIAIYDDVQTNVKARRWEFIHEPEEDRISRLKKGPILYAHLSDPTIRRTFKSMLSYAQKERSMVLALAALEYRLKHGRDILESNQLVPEILPELPGDLLVPARPLVMRKDDYGYLSGMPNMPKKPYVYVNEPGLLRFYSLAWNGQDDHGYIEEGNTPLPPDKEIRNRYPNADDITFAIPPLKKSEPKKEATP